MSDTADRSIPATPRRREAARREGAMPDAAALAWAAAAITTVLLLPAWARATWPAATAVCAAWLAVAGLPADHGPGGVAFPLAVVWPTVGLVLTAAAVGLGVRWVVDGPSCLPGRVAPDPARIDPLRGLRRIVSLRTLGVVVGNAAAVAVLGGVALVSARPLLASAALPAAEPLGRLVVAWRALVPLAVTAAAVAVAQYGVVRWRFERRLRMTPREFAEEARSLQADPRVRLLLGRRSAAGRTSG
jgi:flagellar biosynthetic protein FlhB